MALFITLALISGPALFLWACCIVAGRADDLEPTRDEGADWLGIGGTEFTHFDAEQ